VLQLLTSRSQRLTSPKLGEAAIKAAVDGLDVRGATRRAYVEADGRDVCVSAVMAGEEAWPSLSDAVARRAAARGRRLLPVLDSGDVEGRFWIAYDMGSTTSLADHRRHLLLPTATCLRVLLDVARALDDAAADGLFAYELPPSSVFVSRRGALLADLGVAREALAGAEYELEGDTAYVPSEVLRGEGAGERSGVYLFGALLYHLLTGRSPQANRAAPPGGWQPGLPASIDSVVAAAMADDPSARPRSASEAYEMAERAVRGEPPVATAGARRRAPRSKPAPRRADSRAANGKPAAAKLRVAAAKLKVAGAKVKPAAAKPKPQPAAKLKPAAAKPKPRPAAKLKAAGAKLKSAAPRPKPAAAKPKPQPAAKSKSPAARRPPWAKLKPSAAIRRAAAKPRRAAGDARLRLELAARGSLRRWVGTWASFRPALSISKGSPRQVGVIAVAGALVLGAMVGLVLQGSPEPRPATAQTVSSDGFSVTLPAGWHRAERRDQGLSVRSETGTGLQARFLDRPLAAGPRSEPVQLGALQAWRRAAPRVVHYATPTSQGTLLVTCRAPASAAGEALRLCERTASTLTLRQARAWPLAVAATESERFRAVLATLSSEREDARARLSRASTPAGQRRAAQDLAASHERAAAALGDLTGVESVAAAMRATAEAYATLAASAEGEWAAGWNQAGETVRRSEAALVDAIAAAG
jgi:hypothetical protein